ncbi:poly-gamma-glutamate biosynthesis protein PgsC [Bacteroidota bacterium]
MGYEIVFLGLLISLLYISITGYYPGGIIVPAYLILFIDQPYRLIGTLIASVLVLLLYKLASRYLILYGKRRFVFMILCGGIFSFFLSFLLPQVFPESIEFKVIGFVIPGLIANNFERQGVVITSSSMAIVITAIFFLSKLYYYFI